MSWLPKSPKARRRLYVVLAVAPDAPFEDAVRLMSERGFAEVPVLDAGRLLGVLSWRDVLARQLQGGG